MLDQREWTTLQERHVEAVRYKPRPNEMFRGIPMREWQVLLAAALDLSIGETAELMLLSSSSVKGLRNNLTKQSVRRINWTVVRCLHEGAVLSFEDVF